MVEAVREETEDLLTRHAVKGLTEDERQDLYSAALIDQEAFDQLVEEEFWRQALETPILRDALVEALK